ncbi:hypothetical protein [Kitasatospora sp. NPDC018619]|uniref:hypothetical protein n=1 Tax=unclassified Kitasatospora TaxID=2633591 RepID=UPI0037B7BBA3
MNFSYSASDAKGVPVPARRTTARVLAGVLAGAALVAGIAASAAGTTGLQRSVADSVWGAVAPQPVDPPTAASASAATLDDSVWG